MENGLIFTSIALDDHQTVGLDEPFIDHLLKSLAPENSAPQNRTVHPLAAEGRNAACSVEYARRNFAPFKINDLGGECTSHYDMTKDDFTFISLGVTGDRAGRPDEISINNLLKSLAPENSGPALGTLALAPLCDETRMLSGIRCPQFCGV